MTIKNYTLRVLTLSLLFLIVTLYWLVQNSVFHLPLFWDEAGVYGNGIFKMIQKHISLHPNALPPHVSRGHPLLFTCIFASFGKAFGSSIFTLRICAYFIAFCTIICLSLFNDFKTKRELIVPAILILAQPVFIAQSTLLLPEMLVCLFTILAMWAYLNKRLFLYFLSGACLILTKETGVILIGGICLFDVLVSIKSRSFIQFIYQCIYSSKYLISVIPYFTFLGIQKATNGWFFFPYHTQGFNFSLNRILEQLSKFKDFIFVDQGRWSWLFLILAILSSIIYLKQKKVKFGCTKLESLSVLMACVYVGFYATTYYMNRYVLVVIVLLSIVFTSILIRLLKDLGWSPLLVYPIVLVVFAIQSQYMNTGQFEYDEDLSYLTYIEAQQDALKYIYKHDLNSENIHLNFPLSYIVKDSKYGYISDPKELIKSRSIVDSENIIIINPLGLIVNPKNVPLELVKEWKVGYVTISHYQAYQFSKEALNQFVDLEKD